MTVRDERFEALLGTAAALVAAVFDALPDAIGVVWPIVDETGALVDFEVGYTNPSSERMMGVRLGDEAGARLREVMPGVVPMGLYDRLLRVAESRQAESAEITLDTMWRDVIHVRGVWVHTVLPFGSGLLSVAFDVSEERRREKELRDSAAVAAQPGPRSAPHAGPADRGKQAPGRTPPRARRCELPRALVNWRTQGQVALRDGDLVRMHVLAHARRCTGSSSVRMTRPAARRSGRLRPGAGDDRDAAGVLVDTHAVTSSSASDVDSSR